MPFQLGLSAYPVRGFAKIEPSAAVLVLPFVAAPQLIVPSVAVAAWVVLGTSVSAQLTSAVAGAPVRIAAGGSIRIDPSTLTSAADPAALSVLAMTESIGVASRLPGTPASMVELARANSREAPELTWNLTATTPPSNSEESIAMFVLL